MKTGTARPLVLLCLRLVAVPSVLSDVSGRRVPGASCSKATNPGLNFHPGFSFVVVQKYFVYFI